MGKNNNMDLINSFAIQEEAYSKAYNEMHNKCVEVIKVLGKECPKCLDLEENDCEVMYNGGFCEKEDFCVTSVEIVEEEICTNIYVNVDNGEPFDFDDLTLEEQINITSAITANYSKINGIEPKTFAEIMKEK